MSINVSIQPKTVTFSMEQYERWTRGERADCPDSYCRKLRGTSGFGEFIVGQYFASRGYSWIHHDFDVFGANKPGKYPNADEVIRKCLGAEKFQISRTLHKGFGGIEAPDLLVYKPDYSQIRFAEAKRVDTRDRLRANQVRGLVLISLFLGCPIDVFDVLEECTDHDSEVVNWTF